MSSPHTPQPISRQSGDLASRIVRWQRQHGRHHLPWQGTRDPYRIWLSEIMLQQTQATTVVPWYERFLGRFPDLASLAAAPLDEVLALWAGLGYYARARHLHQCARQIQTQYQGRFPETAAELARLPGIGPSTAAAIAAFAFGERAPILDGNVRRVLIRLLALDGDPQASATVRTLWTQAHAMLEAAPANLDMAAYTQGLMDLGATVCTRRQPDCTRCPLADACLARQQGRQNDLPAPRRRRPRPTRQCHLLILEHQGAILLTRRPERGIWGGLWSLPEFADEAALMQFCQTQIPSDPPARALPMIEHGFTHFQLHIQPWLLAVDAPLPAASRQSWVPRRTLPSYGLPAPIARLLAGLP